MSLGPGAGRRVPFPGGRPAWPAVRAGHTSGACPLRPRPLGGGLASLGGRQHPSSPRPSASHTRLSLAGAAGHPRPRRGDRAGRLLPTATLRSQPGLPTVLAPCAGTTGQSLRSGDAGPVCGPRRAHRRARVRVSAWEPAGARGSCPCRPRPRVAAAPRRALSRPAALSCRGLILFLPRSRYL